jgi:hypothetical protein
MQSNRLLLALALTKLQKNNSGQPTTNNEPQTTNSVSTGIHERNEMNSAERTPFRQGHPDGNPESVFIPLGAKRDYEQQTTNNIKPSNQVELSNFPNIEKRISTLLYGINRKTIKSELSPNNATLRYGTSGVAWIYQQLHHQTGDNHFNKEMEYWHKLPFKTEKPNVIFSGINNESLKAWGILEGLAGILLNNETINLNKKNDKI